MQQATLVHQKALLKTKVHTARLRLLPLEAKRALSLWREKTTGVALNSKARITKKKLVYAGDGKVKALIATYTHTSPLGKDIVWMYYPQAHDVPAFSNMVNYLKAHGPASLVPGSVGSINIVCKEKFWTVEWAQAHFHTKKEGGVSRSLATKYGGWRIRLFTEILTEAKKEGATVLLNSKFVHAGVITDFRKAARDVGLPLTTQELPGNKPFYDIAGSE